MARLLTAFVGRLRAAGLVVGPAESADALAALGVLPIMDRATMRIALRACLVKRENDRATFDTVFEAFFVGAIDEPHKEVAREKEAPTPDKPQASADVVPTRQGPGVVEKPAPGEAGEPRGASARGRLLHTDIAALDALSRAEVYRLARRAGARLARARRRRRSGDGRYGVDWRATLRAAIRHGGEPVQLARRDRPRRRTRLFVFVDVSRSMQDYGELALAFIDGLACAYRSVDIVRFAEQVEDPIARRAARGSGTRIGESLEQALSTPAGRRINRDTVALIVSDGWDAGDAACREAALARLAQRSRAVHWLDPLMGHPGYFASAAGPQHRSPAVTSVWPARHLAGLQAAIEALPYR